ncbi:universal stress protein [Mycobacterium sp. 94-17]|uniref:universal stress protein n=1 Tax=Mycobacterium sp. 94-17 TaxID=2986147 RepID=UPI002D1EA966|nr:universal stress protein [Mycobacterium sp. 94-17]MEB4210117.1 universal stress protein [Mycobacterium sp. 94-17]
MSSVYPAPAILVGVDGSRAAICAAVWAVAEAVGRDIPLRLVYVIDPRDGSGAQAGDARIANARAALADARRAAEAAGETVKIETEILWGRTVSKILEASRSAVMICVGRIGLNHACRGGPAVAASLVRLAACPVAVIQQATARPAKVGDVVAQVDNGTVLRHAFDEARLRRTTLRALLVAPDAAACETNPGRPSALGQLDRRLARWMRLYPDVHAAPTVVTGGVQRYLRDQHDAGQLLVTDAYRAEALCRAGHSVLAIRCGNL